MSGALNMTSLSAERIQEIKDSFDRQGLMHTFGASLTMIKRGHIEISIKHLSHL
jgi:hypothetical protein